MPETAHLSAQTQRFFDRARTGDALEVKALANWASVHEAENELLRLRLRRQQHSFASLLEMVNATASRALDIRSLQNYMLRTVSGHFASTRVFIFRKSHPQDETFICLGVQGGATPGFKLHLDSSLSLHALGGAGSFSLRQLPDAIAVAPEIEQLLQLGIEIAVPLIQEADHMGVVLEGFIFIGPKLTQKPFTRIDIEFLDVLARLFAISLRNESLYRRSIVDTLTGVASRGHFDAQLAQEMARLGSAPGRQLSLVMLDVDHFKKINDTHGHQSGDIVLQALARTLQKGVRDEDLVARYGGEEFALILSGAPRDAAVEISERLLQAIRASNVRSAEGRDLRVTASIGIACYPENAQTAHGLIHLADAALYRSKDLGRDRITVAI